MIALDTSHEFTESKTPVHVGQVMISIIQANINILLFSKREGRTAHSDDFINSRQILELSQGLLLLSEKDYKKLFAIKKKKENK